MALSETRTIYGARAISPATISVHGTLVGVTSGPSISVLRGRFFTAARTSAGLYTVTFTEQALGILSVTASLGATTPSAVAGYSVTVGLPTTTSFTLTVYNNRPAFATGLITCSTKANLADTDYITIGDGLSAPKLYEFDTAGDGVTATRIQVDVSADTTAATVAARLRTAILANQPSLSVTDNTDGTLTVTSLIGGTAPNVTITENVAHASTTVTGLSGGAAAGVLVDLVALQYIEFTATLTDNTKTEI